MRFMIKSEEYYNELEYNPVWDAIKENFQTDRDKYFNYIHLYTAEDVFKLMNICDPHSIKFWVGSKGMPIIWVQDKWYSEYWFNLNYYSKGVFLNGNYFRWS